MNEKFLVVFFLIISKDYSLLNEVIHTALTLCSLFAPICFDDLSLLEEKVMEIGEEEHMIEAVDVVNESLVLCGKLFKFHIE